MCQKTELKSRWTVDLKIFYTITWLAIVQWVHEFGSASAFFFNADPQHCWYGLADDRERTVSCPRPLLTTRSLVQITNLKFDIYKSRETDSDWREWEKKFLGKWPSDVSVSARAVYFCLWSILPVCDFTSCGSTLRHNASMEAQKMWNHILSCSLHLIYVPVCLSDTHCWWHCPLKNILTGSRIVR